MKPWTCLLAGAALLLLAACQGTKNPCPQPTGSPGYLATPPESLPTPTQGPTPTPLEMKLGGRTVKVDRVIEGPLCNDSWNGTIYVACGVQVYPWQEEPLFLKDCSLDIAPGTVVYVAAHNDTAYYNGCSCHTGEIAGP